MVFKGEEQQLLLDNAYFFVFENVIFHVRLRDITNIGEYEEAILCLLSVFGVVSWAIYVPAGNQWTQLSTILVLPYRTTKNIV